MHRCIEQGTEGGQLTGPADERRLGQGPPAVAAPGHDRRFVDSGRHLGGDVGQVGGDGGRRLVPLGRFLGQQPPDDTVDGPGDVDAEPPQGRWRHPQVLAQHRQPQGQKPP